MSNSVFCCKHCGTPIFEAADIAGRTNLLNVDEYQAEVYLLNRALNVEKLKRYDCSLHQGWYCCRFIIMRMIVDKFGTGNKFLVYSDSVIEKREGENAGIEIKRAGQIRLTGRDYAKVVLENNSGRLSVVKLGAIWCPPCRLMDSVISQIVAENSFPDADFFEIDIDEEQELASEFDNSSIPYFLFYFNGKKVHLKPQTGHNPYLLDGGMIGGMQKRNFVGLMKAVIDSARQNYFEIAVG